jgi:hypothetical protein
LNISKCEDLCAVYWPKYVVGGGGVHLNSLAVTLTATDIPNELNYFSHLDYFIPKM